MSQLISLTHISPTSSLLTNKKDNQINLPMDNATMENTESSIFKIASQLSNAGDEVPMQPSVQPCTNFSTRFKNISLPDTGSAASSMNSLENDHSSSSTSPKCCPNIPSILDESEESTLFSTRESTPSPAFKSLQATPVSRQPPYKKKDNSGALESSLVLLYQTMHQRLQNNRNSEITGSSEETFARLIANQLEKLPSYEKHERQQAIMQILYEPYIILEDENDSKVTNHFYILNFR
ncbi:uncharacterized protein LOC112589136 [Harpegnathos saltator]|uniref:uncharacterized protein LOC112589136 n=1 Tax=Harpegnathos saltator TaxID=610380 RepID=UPI000DBEEDDD|nr:uncharacterized protein LOC112589136 [Harpegnathos saltator]XP_025157056.1 uncharacterized protein LOC112589136 [Harpegnathos saltator]XP_025157057.1 uncharacterized protein LOC112589136 [Harpegnathos saltator]